MPPSPNPRNELMGAPPFVPRSATLRFGSSRALMVPFPPLQRRMRPPLEQWPLTFVEVVRQPSPQSKMMTSPPHVPRPVPMQETTQARHKEITWGKQAVALSPPSLVPSRPREQRPRLVAGPSVVVVDLQRMKANTAGKEIDSPRSHSMCGRPRKARMTGKRCR